MSLLYEEETRILRRCLFDVQNEVGLGRKEPAYHRACELWLRSNDVPFETKPSYPLTLCGVVFHRLVPDIVAYEKITLELKALSRGLLASDLVQLFNYLKYRQDRVGLLANLGLDRVHVRRVIYDHSKRCDFKECWTSWDGHISGEAREIGTRIRRALQVVFDEHGTGYGQEITAKLIRLSLELEGLTVKPAPITKAFFRGVCVDQSPLDGWIVDGTILFVHSALFHENRYNVSRGLSYIKALGIKWGVAANFGKYTVTLDGLRSAVHGH